MSYSLYDATIGMAKGAINSLDKILTEAEKHPNSANFFTARLIEDMNPLTFQVHYAAFQAQKIAATLSGQEYSEPEENLDSYEKMHDRIELARKMLNEVDKDTANRIGEQVTVYTHRNESIEAPIKVQVSQLNMPNVYFHVSMAYAILRKEGVPLGKSHWSRGFVSDYI
ncbi:hypothetical protein TRICI_004641 [Trichomonascus ciferrii]|uniref:DUF1993 domain-containing protein n=1 Tax=Trichomonascus ciferrii TaxID=44093 RepID=A0A642V0E9_9ASCO|nr:hypothetical protein TRICI_004641 [Trichomonascus ciferrii]